MSNAESVSEASDGRRLNVVFIIVDDMSVHQLQSYGTVFYETPNIDRLAKEGMRFTHAYGTGPVCSPSRASIMTGKYPARLNLTNYIPGTVPTNPKLLTPDWTKVLPLEERTLGNAFRDMGYATGHFGKWHLGVDYNHWPRKPHDPESQGFDEVLTSVKPKPDADPTDDPHNVIKVTDWSMDFLARHRNGAFFCVIEHNAIHNPEMEHPDLVDKYRRKKGSHLDHNRPAVGAMVEVLDRGVGRLLDKLDELGLTENTLVLFTADHGAKGDPEDLKPLRGSKANLYEGGIRVPLLARWPGVVKPGSVCPVPVCSNDFFPTLLEIAGETVDDPEIDGCSLVPLLKDTGGLKREALYWHYPHYHHQGLAPSGAIRKGRYKLLEWFEKSVDGDDTPGAFELYDLEADISEQKDLSEELPEKVRELHADLKAWRKEVYAQEMMPNPEYDPTVESVSAPPPPGDRRALDIK